MESKKINQLATELTPALSDLTIIGDPTTGISKKITLSQMASLFTGTVEEYANLAAFPLVGTADTIYIALDTNVLYRWDTGTNAYVELSPNIVTSLVFSDANGFDGNISLVGSVATLTITTALTQGSVAFIGASGALTQDNSNFFWDNTNKRLGINTNTPTTAIDAFGSGIIGRLNGTSTNNAFLGFASAGSNKWSIGNVQSDHRFRIYSEANTAELVSVLQTGEFGIGITNPTTKFHIDGGASALIANLDANVSIAKSISFRSDNSARINLEVSGTESGSNAGADLFIRTYTDAGALLATPLTITRSTGAITLATALTVPNGGTGATSFSSNVILKGAGTSAITTSLLTDTGTNLTYTGEEIVINKTGGAFLSLLSADTDTQYIQFKDTGGASGSIRYNHTNNSMIFKGNGSDILTLASTGAATFSSSVTAGGKIYTSASVADNIFEVINGDTTNGYGLYVRGGGTAANRYVARFKNGADNDVMWVGTSNVGIGTGSPSQQLHISGSDNKILIESTNFAALQLKSSTTRTFNIQSIDTDSGALRIYDVTADAERMRITSGGYFKASVDGTYLSTGAFHEIRSNAVGNLMVLQQTASSGTLYGIDVYYSGQAPNNTTSTFITFYDNVNTKAIIYSNGTFGSRTNTYSSISDIKLKENITPATPKLNDLLKVNVVNYNFIDDEKKQKQIGVISQELEEIFPNMVFESEDYKEVEIIDEEGNITKEKQYLGTKTKSVKYSIFVPMLIKAIQEQQAQIDELKLLINK